MERKLTTVASTFGAALAAGFVAPELQADIVAVNFTPGSLAFGPGASTNVSMGTTGGNIGTFSQWNDSIGKTLNFNSPGMASWAIVSYSQTLANATFAGVAGNIGFTTGAAGSVYIGFRTTAGNVGWFQMDLGGAGGTIVWGPGGYGNAGEDVHVGTIPAPAGLAVLAIGAVGIRRNRKRNAA